MQSQVSTFIITREDLAVDPVTLVTDGLQLGRSPDCGLVLNHPTVSRLHAGIKETGRRFYIFNFSHSSGTTLNGRVLQVEEPEVLAEGDVVQIGPFFLVLHRTDDALEISVSLQVTVVIGDTEARGEGQHPEQHDAAHQPASSDVAGALSVFWAARKREAGKMQRLSPMRPQTPTRVLGKARFNWTPTRDLVRPWPTAVFTWGIIIVGILSIAAAFAYTSAFSPAPVSNPHVRNTLQTTPAIARQPNANSCTTCHSLTANMESRCSDCHQAEAFHANTIKPHADAGIGCIDCHAEHRGEDFRPSAFAHQTCTTCHNDANTRTFNGKRVGTPHGGTFGYPIENGNWTWKGLTQEEWSKKTAEMRKVLEQWPTKTENQLRSAQFHVLHIHRVRAPEGMPRNKEGEMSCSSCHRSSFNPVDRETPPTTCAKCHNGNIDGLANQTAIAANAPNCNSCHVQHVQGRRTWGVSLLAAEASAPPNRVSSQPAPPSSR